MPVAQHHHHHHQHTSSLFSSLGNILHARQQSQGNAGAPPGQTSERAHHHDAFDVNLAERLNLLLPLAGTTFVNLASLSQVMVVLLATESELRALIPDHTFPISQNQSKMMNDFFDRSVKLLDVCNAIKEQISEVHGWQMLLDVVLLSLGSKQGNFTVGQFRRAKKALTELQYFMEGEGEEEVVPIQMHRSFRWSTRHLGDGAHEPQRWRSWHGCPSSSYATPTKQLQAMVASLAPPKYTDGEVEETLSAAIYSLNIVSIFFLSTIMAALPSAVKSHIVSFTHPRQFLWASPLLHLQEKVHDETRKRGKGSANAALWELDQISMYVRRLFKVIDTALSSDAFPLSEIQQEEIRSLVKQLRQYVEEIDRELGPLGDQITKLYNRLICTRTELLDLLSHANV